MKRWRAPSTSVRTDTRTHRPHSQKPQPIESLESWLRQDGRTHAALFVKRWVRRLERDPSGSAQEIRRQLIGRSGLYIENIDTQLMRRRTVMRKDGTLHPALQERNRLVSLLNQLLRDHSEYSKAPKTVIPALSRYVEDKFTQPPS